ncbi:NAD-dependent epimerase/dehydratase family protein [Paenibacillus donghaensis]|uniref:NAD-dependent epimerase/dehydratase domain-containing protein n=1 Tax=Paenibacillus donghaensis TaxID=414771 RepID=A0A2Z2KIE7_9BACL|nr:NAD-dependent epimerase/dehydratase family protein [Paenibacillus donghaensis]ASA23895.1 hypothetical protein B9T62_25805 [Paenibacillus donghaensis]
MKGCRLLITGAGGFTGRHAVDYFREAGAEVTAVVRRPLSPAQGGAPPLFPANVQTYICDLSDRQAVARMIGETVPEAVLHLAGTNSVPESWREPLLYMETNVMATLYLLEAMRHVPGSRVLVAGSRLKFKPGSEEGPPHPYSLSKTIEELVSLAWGTLFKQPVLLAEPCNLIGPGPSTGFCSLLARHIVNAEMATAAQSPDAGDSTVSAPFKVSSRYVQRDFLDVRDAVRAYDYILRKGEEGRIYRIDSGQTRQLGEIVGQLLSQATAPVPVEWGAEQEAAAAPSVPTASGPPAAAAEAAADDDHAAVLGWKPQIPLEQSLTDILDYCRSEQEGDIR